ncbi:DNA starvation/stationary phase protection protein [Crocinitomix sp.]|nr:DNA starvation/stationary phase protection protein [Crocinitomix sp.]
MAKNSIGLNKKKSNKIVKSLNQLLADYQQFYMNLRGFHWNVKGKEFFELHLKFEELYNDVNLKVDEIAERILALDGTPLHSFTDYQAISNVKEVKGLRNGATMVKCILKDFKGLIAAQRTILIKAGENGDEGTVTLMSDYITQQEKTVWMLKSYLV